MTMSKNPVDYRPFRLRRSELEIVKLRKNTDKKGALL